MNNYKMTSLPLSSEELTAARLKHIEIALVTRVRLL